MNDQSDQFVVIKKGDVVGFAGLESDQKQTYISDSLKNLYNINSKTIESKRGTRTYDVIDFHRGIINIFGNPQYYDGSIDYDQLAVLDGSMIDDRNNQLYTVIWRFNPDENDLIGPNYEFKSNLHYRQISHYKSEFIQLER
ncbi:hypothetical protein MJH12_06555 [bacterium]|nr:hypothetical protein [bacterium]